MNTLSLGLGRRALILFYRNHIRKSNTVPLLSRKFSYHDKNNSKEEKSRLPFLYKFNIYIKSIYDNKEYNTIPNMITMSRIVATPLLAYFIVQDYHSMALAGCSVFAFSDWLDGYLAKKLNQQSVFGAFLDPLADKITIAGIASALMYKELLPIELGAIIIGRDIFLVMAMFLKRAKDKPPGNSISLFIFAILHSSSYCF